MCTHIYATGVFSKYPCPRCKIETYIASLSTLQEDIEQRGGIFHSRTEWDEGESWGHQSIKKQWLRSRIAVTNHVAALEDLRDEARKEGKENKSVEEALRLWEEHAPSVMAVPGVELKSDEELEREQKPGEEPTRKHALKDVDTTTLSPAFQSPTPTPGPSRSPSPDKPATLGLRDRKKATLKRKKALRFANYVTVSPDHLNVVSPPKVAGDLHSTRHPTAPHSEVRPLSNPAWARRRFQYRRGSEGYEAGTWASRKGYDKVDTSYLQKDWDEAWAWYQGLEEGALDEKLKVISGSWVLGFYLAGAAKYWGRKE